MRVMQLDEPGKPLQSVLRGPLAAPAAGEVALRVVACGVCRTDLHIVDGELPALGRPLVPGHEVVARVSAVGAGVTTVAVGDRVGVPWLGWTCGECTFCASGRENLCDRAQFTGYQRDGGYADAMLADARYVFPIPARYSDIDAAPLLCAGLIGHRALAMAGDAEHLGIYGFGAAAHLIAQVARATGRSVYAFTRPGDTAAQAFARSLGARWAGDSNRAAPRPLDAAILFAPVGALVPAALASVVKGGTVVCAGIHMSDIPAFAYSLLWGERRIVSVANLTRADGEAFMRVADRVALEVSATSLPLAAANQALALLRDGRLSGAAVLVP